MKAWAIFVTILLVGFMLPGAAEASLELGTTTGIGWNLETPRVSLGIGTDLHWQKVHEPILYFYLDSLAYRNRDAALIVVEPRLTARFFLSSNREIQPFVVARVERQLPIVIADSGNWSYFKESNDDWTGDLGAGIRSDVSAHLSAGGEFVARVRYYSYPDAPTSSYGSTNFLFFLQYRL